MFITDMRASGSVVMRTSIRALRCVLPLMTTQQVPVVVSMSTVMIYLPKQSRAARGSHGLFVWTTYEWHRLCLPGKTD